MTRVLPAGEQQSQDVSQSPAPFTTCGSPARACGGRDPAWHSDGGSAAAGGTCAGPCGVSGGCFVPPARSLWAPECAPLGLRTREPRKVREQVRPAHTVRFMDLSLAAALMGEMGREQGATWSGPEARD